MRKLAAAPKRFSLRQTAALLGVSVCAAVLTPGAGAADLILLDGDPAVEIQGTVGYDIVYIDTDIRLVGDTTINAGAFVYVGPNARIFQCWDAVNENNVCQTGRTLVINSAGPVTIDPAINLAGTTAAPFGSGSLAIAGTTIALNGSVNTTGNLAPSGSVGLTASGTVAAKSLTARGGAVTAAGAAGVTVTGTVLTAANSTTISGAPTQVASGGPIDLTSSGGDIAVTGDLAAEGDDSAGALAGGNGGGVHVAGGDVRLGHVDSRGGDSTDGAGGAPGLVQLEARGDLIVLGAIDASGANSSTSAASNGGSVTATGGGHVTLAAANVFGGRGPLGGGGGAGGSVTVTAGSATLGSVNAGGGNASSSGGTPGNGGAGGVVSIQATAAAKLGGETKVTGGRAEESGGLGGIAGSISVAGSSVVTGAVLAQGGTTAGGNGVSGGSIRLSAEGRLDVGGTVSTSGSSAIGAVDPARQGGSGGPILLRAATGPLELNAAILSLGGGGGSNPTDGTPGGAGGNGGVIDVVAPTPAPVVSIFADGGNGGDSGDDRGPGGNGGLIRHWGDGSLFDDTKVVQNFGGAGNPNGLDSQRVVEGPPSPPLIDATGLLSFGSASPDAEGYRIMRSLGGDAEPFLETTQTAGIQVAAPVCVTGSFYVHAFHTSLGWVSASPAPATYTTQPSSDQTCSDAPLITTKKRIKVKSSKLKRKRGRLKIKFVSDGVGRYDVELLVRKRVSHSRKSSKARRANARVVGASPPSRSVSARQKTKRKKRKKRKPVVVARLSGELTRPGRKKVKLGVPKSARKPGTYTIRLVGHAPDGSSRTKTISKLEVTK